MANSFSRTMRSLYADHFSLSLAGLSIAIVLTLAWGYWFFTARVTFYESSQNLYVTGKEMVVSEFPSASSGGVYRAFSTRKRIVVADFPLEAADKIRQGQTAFLYIGTRTGKQAGAIPAVVSAIAQDQAQNVLHIEFESEISADAPNPFEEGAGGEAKVEVQYLTPAELVMQSSGLFTDMTKTSFRPQTIRQSTQLSGE